MLVSNSSLLPKRQAHSPNTVGCIHGGGWYGGLRGSRVNRDSSVGMVSSFFYNPLGIYNEYFTLFNKYIYGNLLAFFFAISFISIFYARVFVPR